MKDSLKAIAVIVPVLSLMSKITRPGVSVTLSIVPETFICLFTNFLLMSFISYSSISILSDMKINRSSPVNETIRANLKRDRSSMYL